MRLELTQLRYFQVAAYYEHISRAAEELNISQPALSTMISRLENELGFPLFDHSGRSIVLNQNGKRFLARVNRILTEVDNSKRELQDMAEENNSSVSLAVSSPQFLQGMHIFIEQHPSYQWNQRVAKNEEIISLLQRGQIDLAVSSPGIYGEEFESTLLLHDIFRLAVHKDHPLAQRKSVRLEELVNERFILLLKGFPFRTQTDQIFMERGITPHFVMECDHLLRRELVNANAGVTIASQSASFRHLFSENIRFLELEDVQHTRDIVLVYRKGRYLNRAARQFAEFLKEKFAAPPTIYN